MQLPYEDPIVEGIKQEIGTNNVCSSLDFLLSSK